MLPDGPATAAWTGEWPTHNTSDEPVEDGDFLAELEQMECEESHCHTDLTGVAKNCVVEALEIENDQYQWWQFDLEFEGDDSRREPAADLLWWNGYDGILVGMVRPEETGFLGAARLDRRDEASEGFDVLGVFVSVEAAQRMVVEAIRERWHTLVNWRKEGF